ncbi:MAG: solute carrier family 35 member SLC35F1/F2/F6 [Benniella sp.]|nr:MAG: solute carrier family 35 member SLC35F1/F2/F6 [Benniella sp.]
MSGLFSRKFLTILFLGQLLSLCITATTIFSAKLAQAEEPVSIPTTQSFLNYLVLGTVYTSVTIYKQGFRGWIEMIRQRAFYYMLFAVVDVEGNYFVVKAYKYTSLLSAMLLDAWTIPCVVLLSVFFLKMRFQRFHYLGVVLAMAGMGFLIWSDMEAGKNFPGSDYLKGDLFCILGASLYAVSNVYQEFLVRQRPLDEVVGQMGFWATILNGVQLAVLERHEIKHVHWTPQVVGHMVGFDIALFIMYSMSPILFRLSSATFFNLSLLTSDFYGLIFGLFLFGAKINRLYPIAYVLIIVGIIVYNIYPAPEPKFNKVLEQDKENKVLWSSAEEEEDADDDEISQQV